MKKLNIKHILLSLAYIFSLLFTSCSSDSNANDSPIIQDETSGFTKIQALTDGDYSFYLYTRTGTLTTGYNEIYLQVKNNLTGEFVKSASFSWMPVMHMKDKSHSCPYSSIEKVPNSETLFKGFVIFQMGGNDAEYWDLTLHYSINGKSSQVSQNLTVLNSDKVRVRVFSGSDNRKYVLAMVDPVAPTIGANALTAYLYQMQDMSTFTPVSGYSVEVDPRMPGMGNHGSANNVNLAYNSASLLYKGKINFTMTGYWKINLIVKDTKNQIIKGEPITDSHPTGSLFFEVEF